MTPAKPWVSIALLSVFAALVLLLAPCVGMQWIWPWLDPWGSLDAGILWEIRVPRVLASFLTGAGLAVCGMVFQALFRSPLASPFTFGVASGASFGSVLAIILGEFLPFYGASGLFALLGAAFTVVLVYRLATWGRHFSISTLLLAGVAINYFFGSAVTFIQYLSDFTNVFRILHSLMGGFEGVGMDALWQLIPFVIPGMILIACLPYELNLLSMGDDIAASRGVHLNRTRKLLFFGTSVTVGGIVAVCGPIGFVGLMAPHIGRLMVGNDHRYLMIVSALLGGSLLTLCDTLSRTVIAPAEIPVGVVTSLLGCPFFVWLLLRQKRP
ncbi:FecCD family ABC transporter permease [Vampirovibrio sp.]|uniref:FecCD family ABC transporter permease n=1 Tax=Vampirovibrio sp. TaxID=2717857 RepID=UPI0035936CE2